MTFITFITFIMWMVFKMFKISIKPHTTIRPNICSVISTLYIQTATRSGHATPLRHAIEMIHPASSKALITTSPTSTHKEPFTSNPANFPTATQSPPTTLTPQTLAQPRRTWPCFAVSSQTGIRGRYMEKSY